MPLIISPPGVGGAAQLGAVDDVKAPPSRLELVATDVLAKLEVRVDAHFKAREAAGQTPYVNGDATIVIVTPDDFASGNSPALEDAMRALDGGERVELVKRVQQQLANAGFSSHVDDDITNQRLQVTVRDPQWNPFPVYGIRHPIKGGREMHDFRFQPDPEGWVTHPFYMNGKVHTVHFNVATHAYEVRRGEWTKRSEPQVPESHERNGVIRHARTTIFKPHSLKPV